MPVRNTPQAEKSIFPKNQAHSLAKLQKKQTSPFPKTKIPFLKKKNQVCTAQCHSSQYFNKINAEYQNKDVSLPSYRQNLSFLSIESRIFILLE